MGAGDVVGMLDREPTPRAPHGGARLLSEADDPTEIGGIGDAEGSVAERFGAGGERLRGGRAIAEGEAGMGAKLDIGHGPNISRTFLLRQSNVERRDRPID